MNLPDDISTQAIVQSFCGNNLIMRVEHISERFCLEYGEANACYDFFIPLTGFVCIRTGTTEHKIGKGEMLCVNPWQFRQISPQGGELNFAKLSYHAAYMRDLFSELYGGEFRGFVNLPVPVEKDLFGVMNNLMCENALDSRGKHLMLDSICREISISLLRYSVRAGAVKKSRQVFRTDIIAEITNYIHKKYHDNITDLDMVKHVHLSKYHMIRQFKQAVGITPREYLIHMRISNAKKMLVNTNMSMKRISELCGFATPSHFAETFRKKTGHSPSEFRQQKSGGGRL